MRFTGTVVLAFFIVTSTTAQVFYGVTRDGGTGAGGTIFRVNSDGTSYAVEHNFTIDGPQGTMMDYSQMVKNPATGKMYGVMSAGGVADQGVLFEYTPATNTYTKKIDFNDNDLTGVNPIGSLAFGPDGKIYGTTNGGGFYFNGTIYEYDITTNTLTKRADFQSAVTGQQIWSGMTLASDGMFYGVTFGGGGAGSGVFYQFDPVTGALTTKKNFDGANGANPLRRPTLYNGKLYGATTGGGANSFGVIYMYDPASGTLNNVFDFANGFEGASPCATLTVVNNMMYGTTSAGSASGYGAVYQFDPAFNSVVGAASFDITTTGDGNVNILTLGSDGLLYGTSEYGGSTAVGPQSGLGVLFQFDPQVNSLLPILEFDGFNIGRTPKSGLTTGNDGLLYGSTSIGGQHWGGTIFSYNPQTVSFEKKKDLNTASEAVHPLAPPVQHSNGKLYGLTENGGAFGRGMIYEFDPVSKVYLSVYDFDDGADGANPQGSLVLYSDGELYGMTSAGGVFDKGTIFSYNPINAAFNVRINFDGSTDFGATPLGNLLLASNGIFYGVTSKGGASNAGILFSYVPGVSFDDWFQFGGFDGSQPRGELVEAGGKLYGVTQFGGANNRGALFEYKPSSGVNGYSVRKHFDDFSTGSQPHGSLVLHPNGKLYGLARNGGANSAGTLFEYNYNSDILAKKIDLQYGTTGGQPLGTLAVGDQGKLYGYTVYGGAGGWGALFEYDPSTNGIANKFDFTPATGSAPRYGHLVSVNLPPVVNAVLPAFAAVGSTVSIFGENFNTDPPQNIVYFGTVRATVVSATTTALQVLVPNGAEGGPISVTVANLTAESSGWFSPTAATNSWIGTSFEAPLGLPPVADTKRSVVADLDGDLQPDIVVAENSGYAFIYRNTSTAGNPSFDAGVAFLLSNNPYTLDVADMDGDGKLDIISAGSSSISILLNQSTVGNISFASAYDLPFGTGCLAATAADLDNDGKPEVIAVGFINGFRAYKNMSTAGALNFPTNFLYGNGAQTLTPQSWDVEAVDVNGDGKIDIVMAIADSPTSASSVEILKNTSSAGALDLFSFQSRTAYPAPGYTSGIDLADLDSDGLPELIITSDTESSPLTIRKNTSFVFNVTFGPAVSLPLGFQSWEPKAADVDSDGLIDIVVPVVNEGRIIIFRNEISSTTFDASMFRKFAVSTGGAPLDVHVADLDLDGRPELVVGNEGFDQVQVFKNMNGAAPPAITSVSPGLAAVGASVNISGSNFSSTAIDNAVFFGATQATVTSASATSLTVTVPVGATYAAVSVTTNGMTGTSPNLFVPTFTTSGALDVNSFATKVNRSVGQSPQVFAVGDLNQDGASDIVVPNFADGTVSASENLSAPGTLTFGLQNYSSATNPFSVAIGDIDRDQQMDFVVADDNGLGVYHHVNIGGTILPAMFSRTEVAMNPRPDHVAIGDIDGDGKPDLVASSRSGNTVNVVRNLTAVEAVAPASFEAADALATNAFPAIVAIGDIDGDGRQDIVVGYDDPSTTTVSVFQNLNDPGAIFPGSFNRVDLTAGTMPFGVTLADVDGDNKLDIIVANNGDNTVKVFINAMTGPGTISSGSFYPSPNYPVGTAPNLVACADLDGDRRPEIVTSNQGAGTVSILKNAISAPGFLTVSSFVTPSVDLVVEDSPRHVAIADLDGDHKPEIISSSESVHTISMLRNINTLGVPSINPALNVTTTSFKAEWSTVSGATGYRIDVSADNFVTMASGYNDQPEAGTSLTVSGLTSGLTYQYRVRAENATGASENSSFESVTLFPNAPVGSASAIGETSFTADWTSVTGATGYLLDVSSDDFAGFVTGYSGLAVSGNSQDVTGLTAGSNYKFRVRASNGAGPSANSSEVLVLLLPAPPTANDATNVLATSFTANWTVVPGATQYRIDVSNDDFATSFYEDMQVVGNATNSANIPALASGLTWKYRVRGFNASGSSGNSNVIAVTLLPGAPVASVSAITEIGFTVNWTTVAGANGYSLDVSEDDFATFVPGFDNVSISGGAHLIAGFPPGATYKFRVRAFNATGPSANSNEVLVHQIPPAPLANAASDVTATSFTANWDASTGADEYLLDVSSNDFVGVLAAYNGLSVSGTSYSVTGLTASTSYKYRVRASNATGPSVNSNEISVQTSSADGPVATAATSVTESSFDANWNLLPGATEYQLDVSDDDFATLIYNNLTVTGSTQSVTGLTPGQSYKYRVRGVIVLLPTGNSNEISVVTIPPAPVATPASAIAEKSFTAIWTAANGATDYYLEVSNDNFFSFIIGYNNLHVTGTSWPVIDLISGGTFQYRLRCSNASGVSVYSNVVSVTLKPGPPEVDTPAGVGQTSFTARWIPSLGATSYLLDVSADNFAGVLPDYNELSVSGNEQEVTGLGPGVTYKYRVKAVNGAGISDYSNEMTVITAPTDPVTTATTNISETSFDANWNPATGADGYYLDVSEDDFATRVTGYDGLSVTTTTKSVTGLTVGVKYKYRIRAYNAFAVTQNSAAVTVQLLSAIPVAMDPTLVGETSFTANWNSATGASQYLLDVSTDDFTSFLPTYNGMIVSSTFHEVTGLEGGQKYKYRVRSFNESGTSLTSNVIEVYTIPSVPVVNTGTDITQTSFTANWNLVAGGLAYYLNVSDDSFATTLPGYTNKVVTGTSASVTGLQPGGIYEYTISAGNSTGVSSASLPEMVKLAPADPVALAATNIGPTFFTANWSDAAGAQVYKLDVSSDDFTNMVVGYDDLTVNGTSKNVTGLTDGIPYKYRVRAENPYGLSGDSNEISVTLGIEIPEATGATSVTQVSFTANWNTAAGATEYRVDVSDDNFASNLPGYDDEIVAGTSLPVTGLTAGSTYRYRVRAKNANSTSANSEEISIKLKPATPTAIAATGATLTSFTANWTASDGADNYRVDVSDDDFETTLPAHTNEFASGTSLLISNLASEVKYTYVVRAENASGFSPDSNPISQVTSTLPTIDTFTPGGGPIGTQVTVHGFNFTYPLSITFSGATAVQVNTGTPTTFSVNVPSGTTTGTFIIEMQGFTDESDDEFIVDSTAPDFNKPLDASIVAGATYDVLVTITDNESQDNVTAKVYFRSIAADTDYEFLDLERQPSTNDYKRAIPPSALTESGGEYYVIASSYGGTTTQPTSPTIVRINFPDLGLEIPYTAFGNGIRNYRMISIPLELTSGTVGAVFEDDLGTYSRKEWRVSHWSNGATNEFTAASNLAVGEGYWLIVKENPGHAINSGPGKTVAKTQANPSTITLKPGWNQIGNPYNFNLAWSDVKDANNGEDFSPSLKTYGGGGFTSSGTLNKMEGAFVRNNNSTADILLEIPTAKNDAVNGRTQKEIKPPINAENWIVDLRVTQGDDFNATSGFGMNRESKEEIDRFDDFTLPRFFENYIELNHTRKSDDDAIALDVVPTAQSYVWQFDVESNFDGEMMAIEWDNSHFGDNNKSLILWDEQLQLGTDMRLASRYEFNRLQSRRFKVFFGDAEEITDKAVATHLVFHSVSPNPTDGDAKVAFSIPEAGRVTFDVYDLLGRKVWSDSGSYDKGYHEVDLTGRFTSGVGMVIIQLGMGSDFAQKRLQIR